LPRRAAPRPLLLAAAALSVATAGCSPKRTAVRYVADTLSQSTGGTTFSGDEDPELVRDALPFALKTLEALLAEQPDHVGLHLALASGFTQYGWGFIKLEADFAEDQGISKAQAGWERARKLVARGRRYAFAGLDLKHPGFAAAFKKDGLNAVKVLDVSDVELAYWAAASLGAEITLSKEQPDVIAELPGVGHIMDRLLHLDEDWDHGTLHEFMVTWEAARPASMGGNEEKARHHFDRAVALAGGNRAAPYVTWAEAVAVARQDRKLYDQMLDAALAVDVDKVVAWRLANTLSQRRARWLKGRAEELILELDPVEVPPP
jgi:predicted anti-sigma-YlaC factor YlaD